MTPRSNSRAGKKFRLFLWFVGWENISLGLSVNYRLPDLEIHLPFCFIKIGWEIYYDVPAVNHDEFAWREKSLI